MEYLHLFDSALDHDACYEEDECYNEPWVAYIEGDNTVTYNKDVLPENKEVWELFKFVFCDNVTDGDKEIFTKNLVRVQENFVDSAMYGTKYNISFYYTLDDENRSRSVTIGSEWGTEEGANVDKAIYQCRGQEGHNDTDLMEGFGVYQWRMTPER